VEQQQHHQQQQQQQQQFFALKDFLRYYSNYPLP